MKQYICALMCALAIQTAYASETTDPNMYAMWDAAVTGALIGTIGATVSSIYTLWQSDLSCSAKAKVVIRMGALGLFMGTTATIGAPYIFQWDIRATPDYTTWGIPAAMVGSVVAAASGVYYSSELEKHLLGKDKEE